MQVAYLQWLSKIDGQTGGRISRIGTNSSPTGHIFDGTAVIQYKQYVFSLGAWAGDDAPRISPAPFFWNCPRTTRSNLDRHRTLGRQALRPVYDLSALKDCCYAAYDTAHKRPSERTYTRVGSSIALGRAADDGSSDTRPYSRADPHRLSLTALNANLSDFSTRNR